MDELFSIEVFVRKVYSLQTECHLPSISFRLLDFPTQIIFITEEERIKKIQTKILENPAFIKDLEKLRNSKGDVIFNKGKSCLFPLSFDSAYSQLSEIPVYVVLTDNVKKSPKFIGSIGISLIKLIENLKTRTTAEPDTICSESIKGSYPIKNLMGVRVAKLAVEVKLYYYGRNLVNHIPVLSNIVEKRSDRRPSDQMTSDDVISSVLQDLKFPEELGEVLIQDESEIFNKTSDLFSPEESDSDKDVDETEDQHNPPPVFYQALPKSNGVQSSPSEPKGLVRSQPKSYLPKQPISPLIDNSRGKTIEISKPKKSCLPKRDRTKSETSTPPSPILSKPTQPNSNKLHQPSAAYSDPLLDQALDIIDGGYDPKRFDLIRAVLTELTYLTDFLDPNLELPDQNTEPEQTHQASSSSKPRPVIVKKPPGKPSRKYGKYGITNSYVLRLSKLGPDKALEVLSSHMSKQSASSLINRLHEPPPRTPTKPPHPKPGHLVDRAALRAKTRPVLVDTPSQTEAPEPRPPPPSTPKVAWEDQTPVKAHSPWGVGGTAPFSVTPGTAPFQQHAHPYSNPSPVPNTVPFPPTTAEHSLPFQSTGSMSMAQVLAAMQALTHTLRDSQESRDRSVSRASLRAASGMDYNYSDQFDEPSCVSILSPLSRPISRAARTPVKVVQEETETEDEELVVNKRPTRNTRYERRSSSIKTATEHDSSSTTSTAASTNFSFKRSASKKSQTSLTASSPKHSPGRPGSPASRRDSANKGCQTPVPARSFSTQTDTRISDSDDQDSSILTVLPSPTRDLVSDHAISSHSSLESGSIYIGSDFSEGDDEDEEDPLKLSYLLSTESVQFSDEDQPTSLLKLCSPSEARAANRFGYTF